MKEEKRLFKKFGRIIPAGTVLFQEGQACDGMYIIQRGQVRLYKKAAGKEITIDHLRQGEFFGEMACLLGQPRSINAVVEEECQLLQVHPEVLDELLLDKTRLIKVVGNLASRLRKAYEIIGLLVEERERRKEQPSS